jgi:hypothetical protein
MVGLELTLNLETNHDVANQIHLDRSNDANHIHQLLMKISPLSDFLQIWRIIISCCTIVSKYFHYFWHYFWQLHSSIQNLWKEVMPC